MTIVVYSHFMTKDIRNDVAEKLKFRVKFVYAKQYRIQNLSVICFRHSIGGVMDCGFHMDCKSIKSPNFEVASDSALAMLR